MSHIYVCMLLHNNVSVAGVVNCKCVCMRAWFDVFSMGRKSVMKKGRESNKREGSV